jgi:molybdenum cofactor cytidylyltransferase
MKYDLTPTGVIILAAGASSRMGDLKQLLPYNGTTLLGNAINQAREAAFERVIVVIGAQAGRVRGSIEPHAVEIVENSNWQAGMGSSISAGLEYIKSTATSLSAVAILLADQPFIRAEHLLALRKLLDDSGLPVAAAEYNGQPGVPAFFRREAFPLLAALPSDVGARRLLRDSGLRVARYPLEQAATDIDTPTDFAALESMRP